MVCRPEEQKRFTVTPETLTGAPARIARDACHVRARRAFRRAAAHDHVLDFAQVDLGALGGVLDDMGAHVGAVGVVEDAPECLADRRAGSRDDNGISHFIFLRFELIRR
jgi:hypothetical protein